MYPEEIIFFVNSFQYLNNLIKKESDSSREREVIRTKYSTTRNLREIIARNIYRYIFEVHLTISFFFNFIKFSFVINQSKLFPTWKNWMCNPIVDCEDDKNKKINWSIYPYFFEYILHFVFTSRWEYAIDWIFTFIIY